MDVYVDKRGRVWLVDFNVFAPVTDALLFSWADARYIYDSMHAASMLH